MPKSGEELSERRAGGGGGAYPQHGIPGAGQQRISLRIDRQAGDSILVSDQVSCAGGGSRRVRQDIPPPRRVIFVSSKQKPARLREGHRRDACSDLLVAKGGQGNHAARVKEFAGAVVRAGPEPKAIREEGHRVDIGAVPSEGQSAAVGRPQIPNLSEEVG
jgi:hypothetical protein